ncbi:MAG: hypothetical protein WDO69_20010 [Pseudomonadota bacterium]
MKLKRFSIGTLGLLAVSGLAWSCSSKSDDCNANLNCGPYGGGAFATSGASGASGVSGTDGVSGAGATGASGSSGTSGDGGSDSAAGTGGAPPPSCDGTSSPDVDACVISDKYGIFVSPTGDDNTANGTQAHPFATVTAALANVTTTIKHVYVCASDYNEPDTLVIPDRVSIYGGFTCDDGTWNYDSPLPAHLLPARAIGATITDAKVGVVIQDVRIDAENADDGMGASSFGMMISGSHNITLKRVEIRAGKGGKGSVGVDGATGLDGIASGTDQNGMAATCSNPPASRVGPQSVPKICGSQGGAGGTAAVGTDYAPAQDGGTGYLVSPTNGGKGGQVFGNSAIRGQDGDKGLLGDVGAAAPALGTFSAMGYNMASGGNGGLGKPGAGGGGGGASLGSATCLGATGGAGGMGGCGGDPGGGGIGGGASVALLSWQSTVSIDGCTLTANSGGAGGDGGKGHAGGVGKAGGIGGAADDGNTVGVGGDGGRGGNGGNGGNGAGGSGGPSVALVYDGTPPTQLGVSILNFASISAAAGKGGTLGATANYGPDGSKGLTQGVYPKP